MSQLNELRIHQSFEDLGEFHCFHLEILDLGHGPASAHHLWVAEAAHVRTAFKTRPFPNTDTS